LMIANCRFEGIGDWRLDSEVYDNASSKPCLTFSRHQSAIGNRQSPIG
jgi:hypothetical protein